MNKERFGNFIGSARRAMGLTQRDLAERLHVTDKAVSKWERGLSYPDVTLLEPLADALGLTVAELMTCRRQEETEGEETMREQELKREQETVRGVLDISRESLRRERRRAWRRILAVLALLAVTAAVAAYTQIFMSAERQSAIVLKETDGGVNYVYVEDGGHLLRLRYEAEPDFAALELKDGGSPKVYGLTMRYNRLTREGTVTACVDTGVIELGSVMNQVGSAMGLDVNPETGDALFGYAEVTFEYRLIYPDPEGSGFLYTYNFWRGDGEAWNAEKLLTVRDCRAFTVADCDGDGVTELLVRTRWPEKPYTVYDRENGAVTESWPDTLDPALAERLLTDEELAERQQEMLERQGGESEEARNSIPL